MKIGMVVRNMGPASTREIVAACAQHAEAVGIDDVWVVDHIAIPKEESEGSGGRYLDPLATLAFVAGRTDRIGLGTGVLVLPYRPPLATAKWVATLQELSAGRLLLGVGVGWMRAEFKALGVARARRGATTDETLAFINQAFARDEVESNGQRFLFLPRPQRPPLIVGGAAPHALDRAVRFGDGWMPSRTDPDQLREPVLALKEMMRAAGKPAPMVVPLTGLDTNDVTRAVDRALAFREAGATGLVHFTRYQSADEFAQAAGLIAEHVLPAVRSE